MRRPTPRFAGNPLTSLDSQTEWRLTGWFILPGVSFDFDVWGEEWGRHKAEILTSWKRHCPGTRPLSAYVCGDLPLPPPARRPTPYGREWVMPDGTTLFDWDRYDHARHLLAVGEIGADEHRRYLEQREALGEYWSLGAEYVRVGLPRNTSPKQGFNHAPTPPSNR